MERREFLATSLGAILTIGQQEPPADEWKVYEFRSSGDFIAARNLLEAQECYVELCGDLAVLAEIVEHSIDRFAGARFLDDSHLHAGGELIAPWIRRQIAEGPPLPCYLFTAFDCL